MRNPFAFLQKTIQDEAYDNYEDYLYEEEVQSSAVNYEAPRRESNYSFFQKRESVTPSVAPNEKINMRGQNLTSMNTMEMEQRPAVVVIKITSLGAANVAADHLRQGKTIICNFEEIDTAVAMRASDFIRGAAMVLGANYCSVNPKITVFVPSGISLLAEAEQEPETHSNTMYNAESMFLGHR